MNMKLFANAMLLLTMGFIALVQSRAYPEPKPQRQPQTQIRTQTADGNSARDA